MDENITYSKGFKPKVWAKLLPYVRPYFKKLAVVFSLFTIMAAIDVAIPRFLSYAVDNFIVPRSIDGIKPFILSYLGVIAISSLIVVIFTRLSMVIEMGLLADLRRKCFEHLQNLSLSYYSTTPVGYILARVMSDTSRISGLIAWSFEDIFWSLGYITIAFISMFTVNARLALIVLAVVPPIALATFFFQGKILDANRQVRSVNSKLTGAYNEGITGAKTSKTLVIEDRISDEFSVLTSEMYRANFRASRLSAIFIPIVTFFSSSAVALVLINGGYMVMNGTVKFGTLSLFISYSLGLLDPIRQMARVLGEIISAQVNIERVCALLDQPCLITDSPEITQKYGDSIVPKTENWEPIKGHVEFKNVWFKYPDGDDYILEDFSLDIPAGTRVAIVGETGAGKSTLVNLVCRFYEPTNGQILIDGTDYRQRSQLWLRSSLGYVLQSPHLFSGTIADNIRYGKLDATDEEITKAAEMVSADIVARKLEKGYDTDVGEGGDRLSTGEKQLISFARAILADPPLFILDEATSSIDTETELLIQNAIWNILKGRTSFIIAHRLSTIRHADIILVVEDGKIIERGSHESLMSLGGKYAGLYKAMEIKEKNSLPGGNVIGK
ncbi:MAG: ABC transporter ATP-binding protein [Clostridiaceae bacterium]|nr:ABC transporter ATP-binding protein [Clostridiaceae bacterium]